MAASEVQLLGAPPSPYVNRVVLALKIKSLEFDMILTNPYKKNELLDKYNPVYKKIPVLIHEGRPICESLNIVQYIDDVWHNRPSILPSDPYDRAVARFWAAYIDDKWFPLFKQFREAKEEKEREEIKEKISEGLVLLEEAFISCSKGKAFFGGDEVGFLDIALGSHFVWLKITERWVETTLVDENKIPKLLEWFARLHSDSSIKDVMLDPDNLFQTVKKFAETIAASDSK